MALAILGDIHGDSWQLKYAQEQIAESSGNVTAIIQVGDFGWYKETIYDFRRVKCKVPVYWIDGNHEDFRLLNGYNVVTEVFENCFYIPRGTVLTFEGKKIAFCGGAASVDKALRLRYGMQWYQEELITDEELARLDGVDDVDILVTHTPPQSVIDNNFDQNFLLNFKLDPRTWFDPSAHKMEVLWSRLGHPPLYCGHMHKKIQDRSCRIIDINEMIYLQ